MQTLIPELGPHSATAPRKTDPTDKARRRFAAVVGVFDGLPQGDYSQDRTGTGLKTDVSRGSTPTTCPTIGWPQISRRVISAITVIYKCLTGCCGFGRKARLTWCRRISQISDAEPGHHEPRS